MARKITRKGLIKKLDKVFSEYIRQRNADKNGVVVCVTCGKVDHWKNMDAGHFISRKHLSTRWHDDNVQVQCKGCNVFRYGEQYRFSLWLGAEKSKELADLSMKTHKLDNYDLQQLIEKYQERCASIKKGLT
jgi:5-methylcytosine-specific restriction endonuclease McrA